jgi:multiple sugar transport system ATP-binding protein
MASIDFRKVTKSWGDVVGVRELDLAVADQEFLVLLGPSGCGKTTTMRMVAGLEEPSDGEIWIGDELVNDMAPRDRDVAMVFQNYGLYPHMTVRENIGYPLKVRGIPKDEARRQVDAAAAKVELGPYIDRKPGQLSGGQRQRVALARSLVRTPRVFLMDEPLSNLDAKLRVTMRTSLQQLHRRIGTTTVYVTHDQVEAMTLGDRVAVMRDGRVQQVDVPAHLYDEPANLFVAAFIGSPAMNLVEATVEGDTIRMGSISLPLDPARRPPAGAVIAGIRPEAFEDAAFGGDGLPTLDADVEVLESIGSDAYVFFRAEGAKAVVVEDARSDDREDSGSLLAEEEDTTMFSARVDPRTKAKVGERLTLTVDPSRLYFFSPETGESVLSSSAAAATA